MANKKKTQTCLGPFGYAQGKLRRMGQFFRITSCVLRKGDLKKQTQSVRPRRAVLSAVEGSETKRCFVKQSQMPGFGWKLETLNPKHVLSEVEWIRNKFGVLCDLCG